MMYVYLITNKINSKKYIGITKNPNIRFNRHINDAKYSRWPIHQAIKKYGKDNFSFEIIETCTNINELKRKERYWIKKLNTQNKNRGYNLTEGGDGCVGYKHTKEHKQYMKVAMLGKNKGTKARVGKKHSEETKKKLSEIHKLAYKEGKRKSLKGISKSEQHKINLSNSKKGIPSKAKKSYMIINPNGEKFIITGLSNWCKENKLNTGMMSMLARKKIEYYKGYQCSELNKE